jgi:hypothetical protein
MHILQFIEHSNLSTNLLRSMKQNYLLLTLLVIGPCITAQKNAFKIPDTLRNKNYDYLFERAQDLEKDKMKQSLYLKTFLSKAKSEQNT